jgi:hypothetical protein
MRGNVHAPIRTQGVQAIFSGGEPLVDYAAGGLRSDRDSSTS